MKLTVPPPFISNMNITMDSVGQTMVFNSYDYNYDVIKRIYNNNTDHEKTRYFWNQYQNKLFEESYINESLRTSEGIMVNIRNINPNYFKINTLYTLNTPANIVNGEYILTEMTYILSTRDYKSYESLVNLKLAKK